MRHHAVLLRGLACALRAQDARCGPGMRAARRTAGGARNRPIPKIGHVVTEDEAGLVCDILAPCGACDLLALGARVRVVRVGIDALRSLQARVVGALVPAQWLVRRVVAFGARRPFINHQVGAAVVAGVPAFRAVRLRSQRCVGLTLVVVRAAIVSGRLPGRPGARGASRWLQHEEICAAVASKIPAEIAHDAGGEEGED